MNLRWIKDLSAKKKKNEIIKNWKQISMIKSEIFAWTIFSEKQWT